jgi:RimJ/RimL family protein N-acetyltransferase
LKTETNTNPALKNEHGQPVGPPVEAWSERARPSRAPMEGHYCRLEAVDVERHAAELYSAYMEAPDGRDWTYLFVERPGDAASFRAYLEKAAASADPLHYTILETAQPGAGGTITGTAVGTAALMRIEPVHGVIEVGSITYSPKLKQTRAGTEAMYLMMRRAFDELGYRRYEWKCDSLNAPSRAAARRYGFEYEGLFRQAIVYKGRSRDTAWFSITDREWPRVKAAFEAWLAPHNFDAAGRQKRSLAAIRDALA